VAVLHAHGDHGVRVPAAHPEMARPYRVWGYPVLPAVFVFSAAVVLYSSFKGNLRGSLIGTGLILLGLPLYEWVASVPCLERERLHWPSEYPQD
jgi:hypothetical protein